MKYKSQLLATSDICKTAVPGTALYDKCLCANAFDAYAERTQAFKDQMATYNARIIARDNYLRQKSAWDAKYTTQQSIYQQEITNGPAKYFLYDPLMIERGIQALSSTCAGCNPGYTSAGTWQWSVPGNALASTYCYEKCKRTPAEVNVDMNKWRSTNPPPTLVDVPSIPVLPSGDNIQCCLNIMQNITANNIDDVNQICNQKIVQEIEKESQKITSNPGSSTTRSPNTTRPPNTTQIPDSSMTIIYIIAGVSIGAAIILGIVLYFMFKKPKIIENPKI